MIPVIILSVLLGIVVAISAYTVGKKNGYQRAMDDVTEGIYKTIMEVWDETNDSGNDKTI